MSFTPFLKDVPLSYAYEHKDYYRNKSREDKFGQPVYFFPPTYSIDQLGCGGPYYVYGKPCKKGQGKKGNCTWFAGSRVYELSNYLLTEVIGNAWKTFDKYNGKKDGGKLDGEKLGDTIVAGDCILFVDNMQKIGDGHIVFVEKVDGNTLYISESGYSDKSCYEDKTCIVYTLNKANIVSGKKISLRPTMPYSEIVYGVIHTSEKIKSTKKEPDYKKLYEQDEAMLDSIEAILKKRK